MTDHDLTPERVEALETRLASEAKRVRAAERAWDPYGAETIMSCRPKLTADDLATLRATLAQMDAALRTYREFHEAYEEAERTRDEANTFTKEHEDEFGRITEPADRAREAELVTAMHRASGRFNRARRALTAPEATGGEDG